MLTQRQLEYCNIDKCHKAGYDGKGIIIWSHESNTDGHGSIVYDVLNRIAPGATKICKSHHSIGISISNGEIISGKDKIDEYYNELINSGASITTDSSFLGLEVLKYIREIHKTLLQPAGIISFQAAGNRGKKGLQEESEPEEYIAVGACSLDDNRNPIREDFSSIGTEIDVMGFESEYSGTSFSSPFVAGMMAIYHQWFKEHYNRLPTYEESKTFLFDNCKDLDIPGQDERTGKGIFILPEKFPEVITMKIIQTNLSYTKQLMPLDLNKVKYIVLHHAEAKTATPEQIHQWHLGNGWSGAGYNEYIRKDGTVYILRGDHVGAHCFNYNSVSYGFCLEGDYNVETVMPETQYKALIERIKHNIPRFKNFEKVGKHSDYCDTVCPGQYFPYKKVLEEVYKMVFEDDASVSKWAKEAVDIVSDAGIMKGDGNGNFRPQDNITREEAAVMMYNLLIHLGKIT